MHPTILNYSTVNIVAPRGYEIGKIYAYHDDLESFPRLVCHRLIKIQGGLYYFKGDNRNKVDVPIKKDFILGEVKL
ncbi:S24/S26 family peptidase [Alkalicella caledoniensis]|uniref:S24/S26 family peptidase n=1 Tax=Alkalicella caledoniensis TaxID=2731377 RepID=A0A7G9WA45_ALKCA|nr:S24/S26 family peptidase [Alkalicella caledoniensis]